MFWPVQASPVQWPWSQVHVCRMLYNDNTAFKGLYFPNAWLDLFDSFRYWSAILSNASSIASPTVTVRYGQGSQSFQLWANTSSDDLKYDHRFCVRQCYTFITESFSFVVFTKKKDWNKRTYEMWYPYINCKLLTERESSFVYWCILSCFHWRISNGFCIHLHNMLQGILLCNIHLLDLVYKFIILEQTQYSS